MLVNSLSSEVLLVRHLGGLHFYQRLAWRFLDFLFQMGDHDFVMQLLRRHHIVRIRDTTWRLFRRSSHIAAFLRPRWHLLIVRQLGNHSCTGAIGRCMMIDVCWGALQAWHRLSLSLLWWIFTRLGCCKLLTGMELFESGLILERANFILLSAADHMHTRASYCLLTWPQVGLQLRMAWLIHMVDSDSLRWLCIIASCREVLDVLIHGKWGFICANAVSVDRYAYLWVGGRFVVRSERITRCFWLFFRLRRVSGGSRRLRLH